MLTKSHRFHGYGSLRSVYRQGRTVRSPMLALRFSKNENRATWRCAVVVAKKVSRSAVTRNRIRRRLYEAVRTESANLNGSYDLVLTVFSEQLATSPADELQQAVTKLLDQAGLITKTTHAIIEPKER
ncbi:MAG TPA: ribonuclease P protein component [Patescibacteria group bacterium]|nr:ribonuclease P protein component [Patescibacteria group bacterium]